ncbi:3-hydroxyacyl-CoA dehydrogenase NAD-binding domain-containing protein [Pseudomonadales bacterium]|jgi:3-hydroxyacyl-CoA dehydrogenase|nr:3-hydroxyacyl-CoA dehydrogenase NAD-binding domain-containing protein [Pseudomonadales bacterium]MDA9256856.1 3-hydroxyacyl-CoA dehydrogenase NAD-binding domain-containing protein [Pseudomonadales bacterium]MDC1322182.1 3-hydroxyacyl-CoA dehydrogenase NAD-binding domain-containing protein [Pseudomonadales bacterium]
MKGTVHYELRGDIALMTIDNPPVNPLSSGVRQGLSDGVNAALADDNVKAIILTGAGRAFIAGADISEFGGKAEGPSLHDCLTTMENSAKPIIAAINGTAFGGGLEVALCCHYRVIAASAPVGLPEVKLGLLPGAGGTQRLPRLIGAQKALDFILSGDPIPGPMATQMGIADALADGDVIESAMAFAADIIAKGSPVRRIRDEEEIVAKDRGNAEMFDAARKNAARKMRKRFAPEMIVQCIEAAVNLGDFDAGLAVEQECFAKCLKHPQRESLIHMFFSEREVSKIPDVPKDTATQKIDTAAVIGCGTMGGGITMSFLNVGIPVTTLEMNQEALDRGIGVIKRNYDIQVQRGRMTAEEVDKRMSLLTGTTNFEDLGSADLILEAIYENIDVKVDTFKKMDAIAKPGAILASNTSALDIDKMAEATSRPESVIGLHFFSPANIMKLLEIVRGGKTSKEVIASSMKLGRQLNKIAVLSGNAPGFIGNRMLAGYTRQAGEIILQGATPYQVDNALLQFGMPMGPFQMNDLVGLDLGWRARKLSGMKPEDVPITARVADKLCEMDRYGQKNNRGYYIYPEGSRAGQADPEVVALVEETSAELGIERRSIEDEEVLKRCLYPLINEGARILEDGIAIRPCDIDIVYINGYGFPEVTGGPMFWADQIGLENILADIKGFQKEYGGTIWEPAPLLERLVAEGKTFASLQG